MAGLLLLLSVFLPALAGDATPSNGSEQDPFRAPASAYVLLFVRSDCPITNRYAPELQRISSEFSRKSIKFFLIYPDRTETISNVHKQIEQYHFPGEPMLDPKHELASRAHATVAPEAAVFDSKGKLVYHGRIDNRWVDVGRSRPAATEHDLEKAIAATLQGKPISEPQTQAIGCSLADVK